MRALKITVSMSVILFVCAFFGASAALPQAKTLTVANLAPMSGGGAPWGINSDRGLRAMANDINARGGIKVGADRYLVEVVTLDHRYIPGEALGAARKLVRDGIKFSFGVGGAIMPAMQPVLDENKVIYFSIMGGGVEFTNANRPYTFREMASNEQFYTLFLRQFVEMWGPIKVGLVENNDDNGRAEGTFMRKMTKQLNLPIEQFDEYVERDAIDFTPVVMRLMAKGVNLLLNDLTPSQAAVFTKQASELGYKKRIGTIRVPMDLATNLKAVGKEGMEGYLSGLTWASGEYPTAKYKEVREKHLATYKEEPMPNVFLHYASMELVSAAIEKAGTTDTEKVVKVLYDQKINTVLGPTFMIGKSLGYGIKTQMSYGLPFCEVRDGKLKLLKTLLYEE